MTLVWIASAGMGVALVVGCLLLMTLEGRSAMVLRLHGAGSTVDADQATIEQHLASSSDVFVSLS